MIALELSGVHMNRIMRITYRFKSWKNDRPDKVWHGKVHTVKHGEKGMVGINHGEYRTTTYVPFDAVVEVLD